MDITHQELSPESLHGEFLSLNPSSIAELVIDGPAGDSSPLEGLEVSLRWLLSRALD